MLALAESAKKRYKIAKSFRNQWPPRKGKNLFKLQIVDNENEPFLKQELAELTHRGINLDERKRVKVKRTIIEPEQIFTEAEGEKVLLEGDAGIGKSAFCSTFISDWAMGEILKQFELLLFLPLSEIQVKISSVSSLVDFLNVLFPFKQSVCSAAAEELEKKEGENLLIIADGWDELSEDARHQGFLYSLLIDNDILPAASILLTSRHSASAQLRDPRCPAEFDRFIEVVGFNKKSIEEYITAEFPKDAKKASDLIAQLEDNPLIESLCVVPLNCAIVCHLWRELNAGLPTTLTELYTRIIRSILIRNIPKTHPELTQNIKGLPSLSDLPEALQSQWHCLCEFAYQAIEKDKIVFTFDEAKQFFLEGVSTVHEQQSCFGLLQAFESIFSDGVSRGLSFHFIHLTIQEFLAAYYLTRLLWRQSPDKILEIVKSYATSPRFGMVWRFFFGISCTQPLHKGSDARVQHLQEVVATFVNTAKFLHQLLLCHCSIESGSSVEVVSQVIQSRALQSNYWNDQPKAKPHSAYDCAAVVSVISNVFSPIYAINAEFGDCSLGDKGMTSLIEALSDVPGRKVNVGWLDLSNNSLTEKNINDLFNRATASLNSLKYLCLSQNHLGVSGIKALEDSVRARSLANLTHLRLAESLTANEDTNAYLLSSFVEALSICYVSLSELDLSKNNFGVAGACCLGKVLSLKMGTLNLSETRLGDEGVCAFIQNLPAASYLNCLYFNGNNIHCIEVSSLAEGISSGILSVKHLYLDDNPLGLDGVVGIGKMLSSSNCQLILLSLKNCQLTTLTRSVNIGIIGSNSDLTACTKLAISEVRQKLSHIPQNNTLTYLEVDKNNFSKDNIEVLAGLAFLCKNLKHLRSTDCSITMDSVTHLVHLPHNTFVM